MRNALAFLVLLPALGFGQAKAPADPKEKFSADEQWMLAVVLSDDKQKAAFEAEAAAAAKADPGEQERFALRWRKKVAGIAEEYKKLLDTDIVPNAPSIEKMVSENEFNLTNYWLMYQPEARKKQILSDISLGNAVLSFRRGDVEAKIKENRKAASAGLAAYMATQPVKEALAYKDPPKPGKAIDELEDAARKAEQAKNAPTPEKASDKADQSFSGKGPTPGEPAPAAGDAAAKTPPLSPAAPGAIQGGLTFRPPPNPMLDREKPTKQSTVGVLAKKFGPAIGGGLLGGILGFLLGGPIGMVVGALIGGGAGYYLGKKLLE